MASNKSWYVIRITDNVTLARSATEVEAERILGFFNEGYPTAHARVATSPGVSKDELKEYPVNINYRPKGPRRK